MVRARLPVPSLLCLFGALLMLTPEVLMGIPEGFTQSSLTDVGVKEALALAVGKYNQDRIASPNCLKQLRLQKALSKMENGRVRQYDLKVELLQTGYQKMTYRKIVQPTGNPKTETCFFRVVTPTPKKMVFGKYHLYLIRAPKDLFCSG